MPEKKSRFLLELNEMPNGGGLVATDFVRLFNFQCVKTTFSSSSTAQLIYPRFRSNYGQSRIFGAFVRKQNAFYGQTGIFQ